MRPKKSGASQMFQTSEHTQSASGAQFVQVCHIYIVALTRICGGIKHCTSTLFNSNLLAKGFQCISFLLKFSASQVISDANSTIFRIFCFQKGIEKTTKEFVTQFSLAIKKIE